jgi:neutral amino acid transport system permease protein
VVETGLANAIVTGIVTGSIVALGAIGLALIYSIAEVPNFAHGEFLMLGAYMALFVNRPRSVPLFRELTTSGQALSTAGIAVLFTMAAGASLAVAYILGGWEALAGGWWPIDVPDGVAVVVHVLGAAIVGAVVVVGAPSIWSGLVLSFVLLAVFSPLVDRYVFKQFRDKGVDLATMLIVALGLSFVLRFGTQAVYGGQLRNYEVPSLVSVGGFEFPLSAAQFFDLYVTGAGVVVHVINTGIPGQEFSTVAVASYGWVGVAAVALLPLVVAAGVYRWRAGGGGDGYRASQTVGPKLAGGLAWVVVTAVLVLLLPGSGTVPESSAYSTRIRLSVVRALGVAFALTMMGLLHLLLKETKLGTAMRASSDNIDLAKITGINTQRVMMATWIIAGGYAAVAGVMLGVLFAQIQPVMGFFFLLPIFAGVILGGIGSVYGAMLGSFAVGLSMDVGIYLFDISSTLRVPIAFFVLFVVLLVKPEGLVGGS